MATTQMQGPVGWPPSVANAPAGTTRSLTGFGDRADPTTTTNAGDTPGPSGLNDHTDVNLPRLASVVWVSTAAHGDTIFWKHDDDYLTAEGGKAYR